MVAKEPAFSSFDEFWPYYLRQHSRFETRLAHALGLGLAVLSVIIGIISMKIGWILIAPVIGYTFGWAAHVFFESNQTATFEYPLWSLRADIKMLSMWQSGELAAELDRNAVKSVKEF